MVPKCIEYKLIPTVGRYRSLGKNRTSMALCQLPIMAVVEFWYLVLISDRKGELGY